MDKLITIRTFIDPSEYELAKTFLISEGIECFGKDAIMNRTYPAPVSGGIDLQVLESNVEKAIEILTEGGYLKAEDLEPSPAIKWIDKILSKFRK